MLLLGFCNFFGSKGPYSQGEAFTTTVLRGRDTTKYGIGQAIKGARRMPRRQGPMKDGASTEMLRGVASRL